MLPGWPCLGVSYPGTDQLNSARMTLSGTSSRQPRTLASMRSPLRITFPDPHPSLDERREITRGYTMKRRLVFVSHCERGQWIRIISARLATRIERKQYEEGIGS